MSKAHDTEAASTVKPHLTEKQVAQAIREQTLSALENFNRLVGLMLAAADSETLGKILGRIAMLADASFLPASDGAVNVPGLAFLTGLSESGTSKFIEDKEVPKYKPGRQRMVRLEDVLRLSIIHGSGSDETEGDEEA